MKDHKLTIVIVVVVALALALTAQHAAYTQTKESAGTTAQASGYVQVRFFDSATGYAIPSKKLNRVYVRASEQANTSRPQQTNRTGEVSVSVARGGYDLSAEVEGYKPISATLDTEGESVEVQLEPLETPAELRPEAIDKLLRGQMGVVTGYVVDEETGTPLPNVQVSLAGGRMPVLTNERGFFVLNVPATKFSTSEEPVSADIRFSKSGYRGEERLHVKVFPHNATIYRVRLMRGAGTNKRDEANQGSGEAASFNDEDDTAAAGKGSNYGSPSKGQLNIAQAVSIPTTIRVGRNCSNGRLGCTTFLVLGLEDYVKRVLPFEWVPSWHIDAQKAGAVAARSYSSWFVNHPINAKYDICDNTACQVLGDATYSQTNAAVDQTRSAVLVDSGGSIAQSEFSSENNNTGCGDGFTGKCVYDPVCTGEPRNGHGRGMCQKGSQRWATGKDAKGRAISQGPQDWRWILNHYYPDLRLVGVQVGDFSIFVTPASQNVTRGNMIFCSVQVRSSNGFNQPVSLSVLNLPGNRVLPGTGFFPQSVTPSAGGTATSGLYVYTDGNTPTGVFDVTIRGQGAGLTREATARFLIYPDSNSFDQQAQRDMANRAARDRRFSGSIAGTFGKDLNWTPDFELRWMAFGFTGGRYVFIYHARAKSSGNRYTSFLDPDTNRWTDWLLAN